jgi:DNA-directed RNA polymerase specialized sigma subunit
MLRFIDLIMYAYSAESTLTEEEAEALMIEEICCRLPVDLEIDTQQLKDAEPKDVIDLCVSDEDDDDDDVQFVLNKPSELKLNLLEAVHGSKSILSESEKRVFTQVIDRL